MFQFFGIRSCLMSRRIHKLKIKRHKSRSFRLWKSKPIHHLLYPFGIRHIRIILFPISRIFALYRRLRAHPEIGSSLHSIFLKPLPLWHPSIEFRILHGLSIWDRIDFVLCWRIKFIIHQSVASWVHSRNYSIVIRKGFTRETWNHPFGVG